MPSNTTRPPSTPPSTSTPSNDDGSRWSSTTRTGAASFAMPDLLAKLGAEVMAVNPYVSTAGLLSYDRDRHAEHIARLVQASGANLGALIGPDEEDLTLIDDRGRVLDDTQTMLAMLQLVADRIDGDRIALPVGTTSVAEEMLSRRGVTVEYTKMSNAALMDAATEPGVGFAANQQGGFVLPGFLPSFDAAAAFVKVLDLLTCCMETSLSAVVDEAPAGPHRAARPSSPPGSRRGW
ncbi:MAG: hypothetical protein U5R31_04290 [Acidimicrobiia bacterium]|nr:hypothetical protein [Acidimicrobiia bacterium]